MVYIHIEILLSHKINEIILFSVIWIDLETSILSEVRKKKTNTLWCHVDLESKIWHKWPIHDIETRLRHGEQTCSCQVGREWREMDWV